MLIRIKLYLLKIVLLLILFSSVKRKAVEDGRMMDDRGWVDGLIIG